MSKLSENVLSIVEETIKLVKSDHNISKEADEKNASIGIEKLSHEEEVFLKNRLRTLGIAVDNLDTFSKEAAEVINQVIEKLSADFTEDYMELDNSHNEKIASMSSGSRARDIFLNWLFN